MFGVKSPRASSSRNSPPNDPELGKEPESWMGNLWDRMRGIQPQRYVPIHSLLADQQSYAKIEVEGISSAPVAKKREVIRSVESIYGVKKCQVSSASDFIQIRGVFLVSEIIQKLNTEGFQKCDVKTTSDLEDYSDEDDEGVDPEKIKRQFNVIGMTCNACVGTVERELKKKTGIYEVTVSLMAHKAEVVYNPTAIGDSAIISAIEDMGFDCSLVPEVSVNTVELTIKGMTCASCTNSVEQGILKVPGVSECSVNLVTEACRIRFDDSLTGPRKLIEAVEDLGFEASIRDKNAHDETAQQMQRETIKLFRSFVYSFTFTFPTFLISMILIHTPELKNWLGFCIYGHLSIGDFLCLVLSTPVQFWIGWRFYVGAYKSLKHGSANMDVLVALGTSAAYFYSAISIFLMMTSRVYAGHTFFDTSSVLITVVIFGKYLETVAKGKTSEAITKLPSLKARTALLIEGEKETEISVDLVQKGDILKVLPGSKIPADGEIISGITTIDESMITGESIPVVKKPGDSVTGATVNQSGMFLMRALRVGSDTTLSKIVNLVQDAQVAKIPIQQFADKISAYFVPIVIFISFLTWMVWYTLALSDVIDDDFMTPGTSEFLFSFMFGISVLVIACPCTLGLATPTAVVVATGIGFENGILIKNGMAIETAHKVTDVVFDKTGTLTQGKLSVETFEIFAEGWSREKVFQVIGSAETGSEHPVGQCIVKYAKETLSLSLEQPENFKAIIGEGVECTVNKQHVLAGKPSLLESNSVRVSLDVYEVLSRLESEGNTVILCAVDKVVVGAIAVRDTIRPDSKNVVRLLKSMGINVFMVTGDNSTTAQAIGSSVGISSIYSNALPGGKCDVIKRLQSESRVVAFVGDGINDSPALAQADIGMAMGSGQDIAIESADIVIVKDALACVVTAIDLSRKAFKRIRLNFGWALIYNVMGIPIAAGVLYPFTGMTLPPMVAGGAMALSSVCVVTSSLMLRLYRPPMA